MAFDFGNANDQQKEAIQTTEGPLLIIAGPGTGKTYTLVQRIVYLIKEKNLKPEEIMVATFTEKAAKELVTRITNELDKLNIPLNLNDMYVGTFHSICLRIIKEHLEYTRVKKNYRMLDQFDQKYMIFQHINSFRSLPHYDDLFAHNVGSWKQADKIASYVSGLLEELVDTSKMAKDDDPEIVAIANIMDEYNRTYYPGSDIEAYKKRKAGDHLQKDYAWRWSKDLYEFGLKKGWIVFQNGRIYTKGYLNAIIEKNKDTGEYYISYREKTRKISTIDFIKNAYSNDIAKKQLSACKIDDRFEYPKPIELIKKLISTYYKKDAVVVDFFAGSGTTAQAVLELNQSDGGHRKFILCTNNENGICENITYNRIKTVITGKVADGSLYSREIMTLIFEKELKASDLKNNSILETIDELKRENSDQYDSFSIEFEDGYIQLFGRKKESYTGIPANLMYYKTDYVSKSSDELTDELLAHIVEMIQLEYGVKVDNKRYVLILDDDAMDDFERDFHKYDNLQAVFISQNVLLTTNQEKIIKDINAFTVPDYYFDLELREAGETW